MNKKMIIALIVVGIAVIIIGLVATSSEESKVVDSSDPFVGTYRITPFSIILSSSIPTYAAVEQGITVDELILKFLNRVPYSELYENMLSRVPKKEIKEIEKELAKTGPDAVSMRLYIGHKNIEGLYNVYVKAGTGESWENECFIDEKNKKIVTTFSNQLHRMPGYSDDYRFIVIDDLILERDM